VWIVWCVREGAAECFCSAGEENSGFLSEALTLLLVRLPHLWPRGTPFFFPLNAPPPASPQPYSVLLLFFTPAHMRPGSVLFRLYTPPGVALSCWMSAGGHSTHCRHKSNEWKGGEAPIST
jgi:hypothetical protein